MLCSALYQVTLLFCFSFLSMAEPVQYCRRGHADGEVDFCMGITMHHNYSTDEYDMYMSMSVIRSSALGWTAIGTGSQMAGSLMFIVYGNPVSGEDPIVSIRTVDGHHQPRQISRRETGGADLRVLQGMWLPADTDPRQCKTKSAADCTPTYVAKIAAVCYSCSRWPGSFIGAKSSSQPWIWAWNDDQAMDVYSFDAPLNMHKHHAGNGGWGMFYVDMARSISEDIRLPSFPPLRPGVLTHGSSDNPIGAEGLLASAKERPLVYLHGISMILVYVFLFPAGVVAIRSKSSRSFQRHWKVQALATLFQVIGGATGLAMSGDKTLPTTHQRLGLVLISSVLVQGVLGWVHHINFVKFQRRTVASHCHIWLGRLLILGGWANALSGLSLSGNRRSAFAAVVAVLVLEILALAGFWVWTTQRKKSRPVTETEQTPLDSSGRKAEDRYFALEGSDTEGDYNEPRRSSIGSL
ncbi:hypothetical protein HD806DRAFT_491726 [Xylariaceae sp. AK1471]|nr:hypothetical protein HD806DRAFT_491726 [Xylariaceae sp. AK1471]